MRHGLFVLALACTILGAQSGPPSGYSLVVAAPSIPLGPGQFGDCVDMVLDSNGDPAITYLFYNPTGTGDLGSSALYFVRWNRNQAKWTAPVRIAVVGDNAAGGAGVASSLAYDARSGVLAVEYLVGHGRIDFASSADGGQTWTAQTLASDSTDDLSGPALAIGGGTVYAAYIRDLEGLRFLSGRVTAPVETWSSELVPTLAGAPRIPISLKIDGEGKPGLAFWMFPQTGYTSVLGFWRPGYFSPVRAGDTAEVRNDFVGVSLAFFGPNPRVAVFVDLDPTGFRAPSHATQSNDGGLTWLPFSYVTPDTGQVQGGHISLAVGSRGQGALALEHLYGNDQGMCGDPLLARSADFFHWTTCTASGPNPPSVEAHDPQVAFDPSGRILLAFQNTKKDGGFPAGVILWHEPAVPAGPQISPGGVVNAASFGKTLAPGSLATIFGTNFVNGPAVTAVAAPLPSKLGEVSVSVNGMVAPLVYVAATQINFQVPYETPLGSANIFVTSQGAASNIVQAATAAAAPGIFASEPNLAVIQNEDYSVNGPSMPAKAGTYAMIYGTGAGQVDQAVPTGSVAPGFPLSRTLQPVKVLIGNQETPVSFAGLAPGFVGLVQVNVLIPDLPSGSYPVRIEFGGAASNQPDIFIE
ncbi:MAG: hypothetical protein M3Z23_04800 [Acidobacteriota bacterium]|nr:hypothetical protein [Acidobacteriota bacterium]